MYGVEAFSAVLEAEFKKRKKRNPKYSLRAFAKNIGTSHTVLLDIRQGKWFPSRKLAEKILRKVGSSEKEITKVLRLIPSSKKAGFQQKPFEGVLEIGEPESRQFEWYCGAILALTETVDFRADPVWIARRLGIRPEEAKSGFSTLEAMGLIKQNESGAVIGGVDVILPLERNSPASVRKRQLQHLDVIRENLRSCSSERVVTHSCVFSASPKKLEPARKMVMEFMDKLSRFLDLGETEDKTDVYLASIQLVPITKEKK